MNSDKKIAQWVGALFIAQLVVAIISYSVILESFLFKRDFLTQLASNSTMVTLATLLDLLTGAFVFAIAVLLFPILKRYSERVALWYVGQRLTELVGFMIAGILLLTLLKIGQKIGGVSGSEAVQLETIAIYLRSMRGNIQDISLLLYCLGAWSFYGLLFHSRLIPRFISVWGLIAVSLLFAEILANVFGSSIGDIMIVGMPLGLNEISLGIWLMAKGLNTSDLTN